MSGQYAANFQSYDLFFLAGKFGSEVEIYPQRSCTIAYQKPILFPILNCEANPLEYPDLNDDNDLIGHVRQDIDGIIRKECLIDGQTAPILRVQSDPLIFPLYICEDNGLGTEGTGLTRAAADGYWVFIESISRGNHLITFRGSCELGRLNSGADYQINVI
jgi:hypothetical protein